MRPSLGSSRACAMPGTIDRAHLATLRGPHWHHPTARMPERRPASGLRGVPDARAGIDAGSARGAGVTGAGASTSRFTGRCWGRTAPSTSITSSPSPAPSVSMPSGLRAIWRTRPWMRRSSGTPSSPMSRRQGNAGLRHRRWHDSLRPAAGAVPRSHRGRVGRAGRWAESERRRLKRAPRHPDRAAASAGGRCASSRSYDRAGSTMMRPRPRLSR